MVETNSVTWLLPLHRLINQPAAAHYEVKCTVRCCCTTSRGITQRRNWHRSQFKSQTDNVFLYCAQHDATVNSKTNELVIFSLNLSYLPWHRSSAGVESTVSPYIWILIFMWASMWNSWIILLLWPTGNCFQQRLFQQQRSQLHFNYPWC